MKEELIERLLLIYDAVDVVFDAEDMRRLDVLGGRVSELEYILMSYCEMSLEDIQELKRNRT